MKVSIVGGTFDHGSGKPSAVIYDVNIGMMLSNTFVDCTLYNGGNIENLRRHIIPLLSDSDVICWFPNISNDEVKIRNIKKMNPRSIVVTSKRNFDDQYSFQEVVAHALALKSNLVVEYSKANDRFIGRVIDPLGCVWQDYTDDFYTVGHQLARRAGFLVGMTRQGCQPMAEPPPTVPNIPTFFELIKEYADKFHELVHPAEGVTRYLGNTSFRCMKGFPSARFGDYVFVSRRNMDKRYITWREFVPVRLDKKTKILYYAGKHKPSVDTPIQTRLYQMLPNINYMLHSHVYIAGAPFTRVEIPCGALQEVDEIYHTLPSDATKRDKMFVNLIGHGSIILSSNIDGLRNIPFYARPIPEVPITP